MDNPRRCPKTLEWHRTALPLFQHYLVTERHLLLASGITAAEVRGWLARLCTAPSATGTPLAVNSIATSARSVRAFCHWLVRHGHLEHSPFAMVPIPTASQKALRLLDPTEFDCLLQACQLPDDCNSVVDRATARNRAILWVLRDTGMSAAEVCHLRLGDVDREHGKLLVRGKEARVRQLALSPQGWLHLLCYLEEHRLRGMAPEAGVAEEDSLFLSETYRPLTPNALALLFARLSTRAGISGTPINPSLLRDTFAVHFLQTGGNLAALQEVLGLETPVSVKRYRRFCDQLSEQHHDQEHPADQGPKRLAAPRKPRRHRER